MAISTTVIEASLNTKMNATTGTTDGKEFLLLGKAVEALTPTVTVSSVIAEGTTQVGLVTTEGNTQVANVQAAAAGYAPLADPTFTGTVNAAALTLSGNLTVNGTTTTVNSTTMDVADINITVANGAANSAAADGAGLTIEGAGVNFQWSDADQQMSLNKSLAINGTLDIEEVYEKVNVSASTTGALAYETNAYGVLLLSTAQTANRTINFTNVNTNLAIGQSVTCAVLATQGSTAYYLNAYQVDGSAVTPKWSGGAAPTGGNASGIDSYSFTIIKTADATFTVLASQTQFA